jgi:hypothetical protein
LLRLADTAVQIDWRVLCGRGIGVAIFAVTAEK